MSVSDQSPSFNSSQSITYDNNMETSNTRLYIKEMLKSKIFLGRYLERRLIDESIGYRDVVLVSAAEVELKRQLLEVRQMLLSAYPSNHWIGIAESETLGYPSGVCLLTEIDNEPLGPFWFQIRNIKFRVSEIIVTLICLRHITDSYLEIEPILTGGHEKPLSKILNTPTAISESNLNETFSEVIINVKNAFTLTNVKELLAFIFALIVATFTGGTAFINFLGNFILAFIRETSILIKNSTPMFLGFLDFLSKIVGGFYILVAMFFKPNNPKPLKSRRSIAYYNSQPQNCDYRDTF
ncbi:uncharacterized protein LOC116769643 [Danaus plexippus]|uniref:uncharacterized protein LOC116769643 n=1 Tax=Danaus plexippus TaxID=13037 RepID=UPI002AB0C8B6|nr:uncharacterized protein LOC116769643 [Danaus plexippus]